MRAKSDVPDKNNLMFFFLFLTFVSKINLIYLMYLFYFVSDSLSQGLQTSNSLTSNNYSLNLQSSGLGFGNSTLGTIGSPSIGNLGGG